MLMMDEKPFPDFFKIAPDFAIQLIQMSLEEKWNAD